jgi:hypothetical protein
MKKSKSSLTYTHLPAIPTVGHHLQVAGPPHPKLAAPRPHRAAPWSLPRTLTAAPRARRPMLPRYCHPELVFAAPSSSPAGQEWGRGGDPSEMGQGEEIRRRWSRGGDPPEMGQGEDSHRQGCPEVEARWPATGKGRHHLLFYFLYWADKWAPVYVSTNRIFFASSALTGRSHLSDLVSICVQLAISANCKKIPEKLWFFAIET